VLHSEEGAQQGDPPGPLYFCLTIKELLESMQSELIIGYLDDIVVGGDAKTCLDDFLYLEDAARRLGLEMNRSKCEVVGHTKKTRTLCDSQCHTSRDQPVNRCSVGGAIIGWITPRYRAGWKEARIKFADKETWINASTRQPILAIIIIKQILAQISVETSQMHCLQESSLSNKKVLSFRRKPAIDSEKSAVSSCGSEFQADGHA
jgi:Reverse transcriptase (RNA-dependent DNA polymerase)